MLDPAEDILLAQYYLVRMSCRSEGAVRQNEKSSRIGTEGGASCRMEGDVGDVGLEQEEHHGCRPTWICHEQGRFNQTWVVPLSSTEVAALPVAGLLPE